MSRIDRKDPADRGAVVDSDMVARRQVFPAVSSVLAGISDRLRADRATTPVDIAAELSRLDEIRTALATLLPEPPDEPEPVTTPAPKTAKKKH